MLKIKEFFTNPHIQIALAAGVSIIVLAYFSKRVFPEPIDNLLLALPPFIATIYEALLSRYKKKKICTPWYWVVAVLLATALVILFHMV